MKNMKVQCPTCSETMELQEEQHVCVAEGCDTSLSISEAEDLFGNGKLIVIAEDQDIEELIKESDEDETVNGYSNADTWNASVIAEREYSVYKKFKVAHKKEKLDESFTKSVLKDELFEGVDLEEVNTKEITDHMSSVMETASEIGVDLVTALFAESDLTDEQKDDVVSIFESAVDVRVKDARQMLKEESEVALNKAIEEKQVELEEQASEYVDHVVSEWRKENELVIEKSLKVEYAENFINGLRDLFESCYVDVPADRFDIVEALDGKVEELEKQLDESLEEKRQLAEQIIGSEKEKIVAEITEGLVETQKERIQELSETVEYKNSDDFRKNVEKLKSAFLQENNKDSNGVDVIEENVIEEDLDNKDASAMSAIDKAVQLMNGN